MTDPAQSYTNNSLGLCLAMWPNVCFCVNPKFKMATTLRHENYKHGIINQISETGQGYSYLPLWRKGIPSPQKKNIEPAI
jgi:hypothetical protein